MSGRERLPNRRRAITETLDWNGLQLYLTLGLAPDGRPLELFVSGAKVGSDRDCLLEDAAVITSRLLQHGDCLTDIAAGIGRLPHGAPASLIGAIVDRVVEIEGSL
jgi:hypothetical protein